MSPNSGEKQAKQTKIYRKLGQGIRVLHEHQHAELDISAVPGLGANPEECWTWEEIKVKERSGKGQTSVSEPTPGDEEDARPPQQQQRQFNWMRHQSSQSTITTKDSINGQAENNEGRRRRFNWIRDSDGLASLFPKSRILLYDYASAWRGQYKVRATMKSICTWLLDDLKEKRKGASEITRPLIIIGHSMGGIVVTKMLCMAKAKRDFEAIVTCTMGCAFFGTPFRGTDMAKIALLYNSIFGQDAYESLLQFMRTERNDVLDEVTDDFMEINSRLVPPIELFCAWEQVATAVSYADRAMGNLPALLEHKVFKASARRMMKVGLSAFGTSTHFVEMESAVLQGSHSVSLTAGHSDLIKFESVTCDKFLPVKVALTRMVQGAKMNARRRTVLLGQRLLTQKFVNQVRQSLEGVDMKLKLRAKIKQRSITSWLVAEPAFVDWSTSASGVEVRHPFLWLKGGPGLGKADACLAAIQSISKSHNEEQQMDSAENFLAYFLCDWSSGCCTAEDMLKGLMTQIINEEESLAQHAKWFVPTSRYRGPAREGLPSSDLDSADPGAMATATVDNLWKCLQDMIEDPIVNSLHIVISNLHCLETGESTNALLLKLRDHANSISESPPTARRVKWLISSRNDRHISEYLKTNSVSIVDMEDNHEYGAKIKGARRKYAKEAVMQLRASKGYSADLSYVIRNSIESRSEDEKWIDMICSLLGAMPDHSTDLAVRQELRNIGHYNIRKLVEYAWETVLAKHDRHEKLEIEELIRVLTTAYEPPSITDLAVLMQTDDPDRLTALISGSSPILMIGDWNEHKDRVVFGNAEFEEHLSAIINGESDQKQRHHGSMALRCFAHIANFYANASNQRALSSQMQSTATVAQLDANNELVEVANEDEDLDESSGSGLAQIDLSCTYPIKYLFRHLSEGFPDVAQELYEDDPGFWGLESKLRTWWLRDFQTLTTDLKELNVAGMSALHVAAGIGATEVVSTLLGRNGVQSLAWTNLDGLTALHVAANNNHSEIVDALIRAGADVEAGEGGIGTALHFAALRGNCSVMSQLIEQGANVNAFSTRYGPVINAAILSGTVDAVQQIMNRDVRFSFDYTKCEPPISLSAGISEPGLFSDILDSGREKWLQNNKLLDQALIRAAYGGRLESLHILLDFPHNYTNNTIENALLSAAQEKNWLSVNGLLDYIIEDKSQGHKRDLQLGAPFYLAANSREERVETLQKIWQFADYDIPKAVLDFSLYQATISKKNKTVIWLLESCGADANAVPDRPRVIEMTLDHNNWVSSIDFGNPFNAAASSGNFDLVRALVRNGADINTTRGYSLQLAASEGHLEVVEMLLQEGAKVNREMEKDEDLGFYAVTALQAACESNHVGIVRLLLQHGADPNLGGGASTNPITAATQRPETEALKLLLETPNIDVNVEGGEERSTPLINAATHMTTEAVRMLLEKGASVDARNAAGDTALVMAALKGNDTCVAMLCEQGADVTITSPRYGLPVQAAAKSSSAMCAQVLAERMGGAIATFRDQVQSDHATLEDRDRKIKALQLDLEDALGRLETARKEVEEHEHQKQAMLSMRSLQGSAYEAVDRRVRTIQEERDHLQRQLESERGQCKVAEYTALELRKRLEDERIKNDALRSRTGLAAMQEELETAMSSFDAEKKATVQTLEAEKRAHVEAFEEQKRAAVAPFEAERDSILEKCNQVESENLVLRLEAADLRDKIEQMEKDSEERSFELATALQESLDMTEKLTVEKQLSAKSTEEAKRLEGEYWKLQKMLADGSSVKPNGNAGYQAKERPPSTAGSDELYQNSHRNSTETVTSNADSGAQRPDALQQSPSNGSSIGSPTSPPGFRTIHGQHRPDGALGGYRQGKGMSTRASSSLSSPRVAGSPSLSPPVSPAPALPPRPNGSKTQ